MDGSQRFGFGVMIETRQHPGKREVGAYGWGGIVSVNGRVFQGDHLGSAGQIFVRLPGDSLRCGGDAFLPQRDREDLEAGLGDAVQLGSSRWARSEV